MTLVLSAICSDAVVMVADRRMTWRPAGPAPEERNKLVVYKDRFAFAFSGLAEIEGLPVDGWLARGLRADDDFEAALRGIARRASDLFARLPASVPKHQAFVGVGWRNVTATRVKPLWTCISNAWDPRTSTWLKRPKPQFSITALELPPGRRWILCPPIGVALSPNAANDIQRLVRPALKQGGRGPRAAKLLGRAVQDVAKRKPSVGSEPTCVVLPRPRLGQECRILAPPVVGVDRSPGPVAFDLINRKGAFRWAPPIVVFPGVMLVPEISLGPEGTLESFRVKTIQSVAGVGSGVRFGIGVTNGKKEGLVSLDRAGTPLVEGREGD
jgi:hypothetical protein